jgi:hypothetical protein
MGSVPRPSRTVFPGREDCWSEDATHTLIEAWGDRHLELNRGNLRQRHWQQVAAAVNACHGHDGAKSRRSDVQCKNRIDTLKKKYKIEKARVSESGGAYASEWPFFASLDALVGSTFFKPSPLAAGAHRETLPDDSPAWTLSPVPVGPRTKKRPAASEAEQLGSDRWRWSVGSDRKEGERGVGYRELAQAIERVGEIYERVEGAKLRQMIELEKQRMQFAKDLECHRMQLLLETQVQLQKIKRASWSGERELLHILSSLGNSVHVL